MKFKLLSLVALAALAVAVGGCGNDNTKSSMSAGSSATKANATDAMFVAAMIPHHQSAVEMAQLGLDRSERSEIKELSQSIVDSQSAEIADMKQLQGSLPSTDGSMMSKSDMAMMSSSVESLKKSDDFDKAFIDAMIPHHRSAIVMAKKELADGADPTATKLAQAIVKAQTKEIAQMQAWRKAWYGSELPEPKSSSDTSMDSSMQGMH